MFWAAALITLMAAGCGNDDGGDVGQPVEPVEAAEPEESRLGDFELVIGSVMPETGSLAFLGTPMIVSVDLAVQDIQAAGAMYGC